MLVLLPHAPTQVYQDRFEGVHEVARAWNFDAFVRDYRPQVADQHLQNHYALEFSCEDRKVNVRSKQAVAATVPYGPKVQLFPPVGAGAVMPRPPDEEPQWADLARWEEFEPKIAATLRPFYDGTMDHPVPIPQAKVRARATGWVMCPACVRACLYTMKRSRVTCPQAEEMLAWLRTREMQPPRTLPKWPAWTDRRQQRPHVPAVPQAPARVVPARADAVQYVPFLGRPLNAGGRTCRCGSSHHLTTNYRGCPLNPRKRAREDGRAPSSRLRPRRPESGEDTDEDTDDSDDSVATRTYTSPRVRFPVGTKVARHFEGHGLYQGEVIFPRQPCCPGYTRLDNVRQG